MNLIEEIKNGEGKNLEFKEKLSKNYNNFLKTIVAFANGSGGKVVIGVNNSKEVVGISDDELFDIKDRIADLISEKCSPTIIPEIYTKLVEGKNILVVKIFPGQSKPYYLKGKKKRAYIRIGATTKIADENTIKSLEREKLNISYDEEILYSHDVQKINFDKLSKSFFEYTKDRLTESKMLNMKILRDEAGKRFLTRGGALLLGLDDVNEFAGIRCARFKGNSVNEFIDAKDYYGALHEIIEKSMKFAKSHIEKKIVIKELKRIEEYAVPLPIIREALVNAVIHRDYSINSDIKFAIFDNRIEITSPGGLPGNLNVESIKDGRSEIRNKVIARFFKKIGYIEQWGTGIIRMLNLCKSNGLKEPEFIDDGRYFKVIIHKTGAGMPETGAGMPETGAGMPETGAGMPETIKNFITINGKITRRDVQSILNVKERRARYIIKKYIEHGLLKKEGRGKKTYYVLARPDNLG